MAALCPLHARHADQNGRAIPRPTNTPHTLLKTRTCSA
uniref:Uncharacterized protein n=1 Tax=Arundo donax TaxID=35708 RepID=A0A0A8ZMZ4_ARUDO